jgi:hypothetical protein
MTRTHWAALNRTLSLQEEITRQTYSRRRGKVTSLRCALSCSLVASFLVAFVRNRSASSKEVKLITFSSVIWGGRDRKKVLEVILAKRFQTHLTRQNRETVANVETPAQAPYALVSGQERLLPIKARHFRTCGRFAHVKRTKSLHRASQTGRSA